MAVYIGYSALLTPSRTKDIKTPNFPLQNHTTCRVSWAKGQAAICSIKIYVGCFTMLTLLRFKHFLMLCRTRGMKIGNFLSRNRHRNWLLLIPLLLSHIMSKLIKQRNHDWDCFRLHSVHNKNIWVKVGHLISDCTLTPRESAVCFSAERFLSGVCRNCLLSCSFVV